MQTIITKEIDGLEIVLGVDTEKIDQVATAKKIEPFLQSSKEFIAKKTRLEKIRGLTASNDSLDRQGKTVINRVALNKGKIPQDLKHDDYSAGEIASLNKYNVLKTKNTEEVDAITLELPEVENNLLDKKRQLIKQHGVFFNLKNEYEARTSDEDANSFKAKIKAKGKKQFILIDGSIIDDNRNKTFFGKISGCWEKLEIKLLSDKVDKTLFFLQEDLTPVEIKEMNAQFETDRIKALSVDDKRSEKNTMIESALNQSATMKNKLEIVGDKNALTKAQEFYNSENVLIEDKYL